ncbi:hypothetical protein Nepgr_018101 [Nepenthes gracilis]|uniref:Uncharacterized protein n=1 Tax=Nepenthes gracilis TaxID=150966 RepID=A0AAD3XU03_NEPGR|nr:hypothetical protein Nepgr_018101 [Nepenthes gracilis]
MQLVNSLIHWLADYYLSTLMRGVATACSLANKAISLRLETQRLTSSAIAMESLQEELVCSSTMIEELLY